MARAKELYSNATSALDFAYDPSEALRQKETIVSYLKDIWESISTIRMEKRLVTSGSGKHRLCDK